ncbi:MAG: sigma-70 family RNA polymerase sigma factor [Verrucomicrobia bacterium]|nr:sigma-70 family RNA polymerase sigma factor [Verrucomicrobiota bacterium]
MADIQETDWDEAGCVARVRQGDEDAARELMRRLHPLVVKVVRSHLPRRTSEEDLVQMVFAKVFSKLDQFSGIVPLPHWVSRVAVNTCLNQLDHERVRPEVRWADLSADEEAVLQNLARTDADLPGSQAGAARELVERLLASLGPEDRLVITLLHLEERSVEEVSAMTGWNRTLVKVRAFRARQRMKRALKHWMREERP